MGPLKPDLSQTENPFWPDVNRSERVPEYGGFLDRDAGFRDKITWHLLEGRVANSHVSCVIHFQSLTQEIYNVFFTIIRLAASKEFG